MRTVELPEREAVKLVFDPEYTLSEEDYLAFCRRNPEVRCERTAKGEIVIVPAAGGESAYRSLRIGSRLEVWAVEDGRGKAFDSSAEFILPDGSALSPDAAWVSNESLERLSWEERRQFLRLTPEFIIEVMSPSDRLRAAKAKMENWVANGVSLAWLVDGDNQTVYVYKPGRAPLAIQCGHEIAGEGAVEGFVLDLDIVWRGLR